MLWACVVANGLGSISRGDGRMDSVKFQQILEANMTSGRNKKRRKVEKGWRLRMEICLQIHSDLPQETQAEGFTMAHTLSADLNISREKEIRTRLFRTHQRGSTRVERHDYPAVPGCCGESVMM